MNRISGENSNLGLPRSVRGSQNHLHCYFKLAKSHRGLVNGFRKVSLTLCLCQNQSNTAPYKQYISCLTKTFRLEISCFRNYLPLRTCSSRETKQLIVCM